MFAYIIEFPQNLLFTISVNQTLKFPIEYATFLEDVFYQTVNVIGQKVKASRRVSYPVLKLLIRENTLVLPLRLNMAFTAA